MCAPPAPKPADPAVLYADPPSDSKMAFRCSNIDSSDVSSPIQCVCVRLRVMIVNDGKKVLVGEKDSMCERERKKVCGRDKEGHRARESACIGLHIHTCVFVGGGGKGGESKRLCQRKRKEEIV